MKKILYILSAAVVMATACTREANPAQQSVLTTTFDEGAQALVTFKVTVPETSLFATETRAVGVIGEQPTIANGDLYVAVFGAGTSAGIGGNLQNFLKATLAETIVHDVDMTTTTTTDDETGETTTTTTRAYTYVYEVLMPLSNDPLVLDFMAGACDSEGNLFTLDNPIPVKYEAEVMPLLFSINGNAAYWQRVRIDGVFPKPLADGSGYEMTQYVDEDGEVISTEDQDYVADEIPELDNVQLIRNFAKVTFTATSDAPFTLDGFYLVDTPKSGSVAPYSATAGYNTAYTTATDAGVIFNSYNGYVLSQVLNSGIDGFTFKTPGTQFEYMYERTIPSVSAPVFAESGAILKVTWKSTSENASLGTRYYKVSFVDESGYVPILRNIQYNFQVSDITADQHPTSAADAYAGPFLGDVSANVATAMLDEISNNKSRITVSEMSKTAIGSGKSFDIDFYFYPVDGNPEVVVTNGKTSTAAGGTVTISTTILDEGSYAQAIKSISDVAVTRNGNADQRGTITVTLNDSETGVVKKGKVRILGQVAGMRALYREVVFTVMEKQAFADGDTESSVTPLASDAVNQETTVTIQLPDGLPRDIFPLQIKIEAANNSLTSIPDNSATPAISALPVKYGTSAFNSSKNSYYFVKTITFDDYATLNGVAYEYTNAFPCKFKTRLANGNTTKIRINDINEEYFVEKELTLSTQ